MNLNNLFFYIINSLSHYHSIASFSIFVSYSLANIIILSVIIWLVFFTTRKLFNTSLVILSTLSSWYVADILKFLFKIPRPHFGLGITPVVTEYGSSFPSEHSAVFAAIAMSAFFINRKVGIGLFIFATIVGLSRIILGVHYPFDVLVGWLVGVTVGLIIFRVFKKI